MNEASGKRPLWQRSLGLLFLAHLLFCVQRLERRALPDRLKEIEEYQRDGAVAFHLGKGTATAAAVQFLLDHTPEDAVILHRGGRRGLIEHAAALLAPRLLFDLGHARPGQTAVHGRAFARATHPDLGTGTLVLVTKATHELRLELR